MNELQAKLARRRNLNGEVGGGESIGPVGSESPTLTIKRPSPVSIPSTQSTPVETMSSATLELQMKLARRRNLNGELSSLETTPTSPTATNSQVEIASLEGSTLPIDKGPIDTILEKQELLPPIPADSTDGTEEQQTMPIKELPPPIPQEHYMDETEELPPPIPQEHYMDETEELPPPIPQEHYMDETEELPPPIPQEHYVDETEELPPPIPQEHYVDETEELPPPPIPVSSEEDDLSYAESERIAAEKAESERIAAEKAESERIAAEKAESERIAAEKAESERIAAEKAESERIAAEKAESERIAAEKAESERIAAEKAESECIAAEKAESERIAAEKAESERIAAEKAESERIAAEKAESERIAAEKAESERIAAEKAESECIAAEKAESERIAAEKAESERIAAEKAESERIAAEKAESERIAAEKAESERIAAEKAEAERIATHRVSVDSNDVASVLEEVDQVLAKKSNFCGVRNIPDLELIDNTPEIAGSELSREDLLHQNAELRAEIVRLREQLRQKQRIIDALELSSPLVQPTESLVTDDSMSDVFQRPYSPLPPLPTHVFSKQKTGASPDTARQRKVRVPLATTFYDDEEGGTGLFDDLDTTELASPSDRPPAGRFAPPLGLFNETDVNSPSSLNNGLDDLIANNGGVKYDPRAATSESDLKMTFLSSSRLSKNFSSTVQQLLTTAPSDGGSAVGDVDDVDFLGYEEFLPLFFQEPSLVQEVRLFIQSVRGPYGDGRPPATNMTLDYIFYGTEKLPERCADFFDRLMRSSVPATETFRHETPGRLDFARDCLEQFVFSEIGALAYGTCADLVNEDETLNRRISQLQFLIPDNLDIRTELFIPEMLALAGDNLQRINKVITPAEKAACVIRAVTIVFQSLSKARQEQEAQAKALKSTSLANEIVTNDTSEKDGESSATPAVKNLDEEDDNLPALAGADDFLPLFIWVVLRYGRNLQLCENSEYIQLFLNPRRMMSKAGYCLINLRTATEFLSYTDASGLVGVSQAVFDACVQ